MILAALIATITRGVVTGIPYSIAGPRSAFRVVIDAKTRAEPAYKRRVAQCERLTRSTRSEGFLFHCKNGNFSHLLVDYLYILWLNWRVTTGAKGGQSMLKAWCDPDINLI